MPRGRNRKGGKSNSTDFTITRSNVAEKKTAEEENNQILLEEPSDDQIDLFNIVVKTLFNKYAPYCEIDIIENLEGQRWYNPRKHKSVTTLAVKTIGMSKEEIVADVLKCSFDRFHQENLAALSLVVQSIKNIDEENFLATKEIFDAKKDELLRHVKISLNPIDFARFSDCLNNFFDGMEINYKNVLRSFDNHNYRRIIGSIVMGLIDAYIMKDIFQPNLSAMYQSYTLDRGVNGVLRQHKEIIESIGPQQLQIRSFYLYEKINAHLISGIEDLEVVISDIEEKTREMKFKTAIKVVPNAEEDHEAIREKELLNMKFKRSLKEFSKRVKAEFAQNRRHQNSLRNTRELAIRMGDAEPGHDTQSFLCQTIFEEGQEGNEAKGDGEEKENSELAFDPPSSKPSPASAQPLSESALKNQEDEEKSKENFRQELACHLRNNQIPLNFLDNDYLKPEIMTGMYRSLRAMENLDLYSPEDLLALFSAGGLSEEDKTNLTNSFLTHNIRNFFKGQIFTMDADGNKVFNSKANKMANLLMHNPDYLSFKQKQQIAQIIPQQDDQDFTKNSYIERVLNQIGVTEILELYDPKKAPHSTSGYKEKIHKEKIANIKKLFASIDKLKELLGQENSSIYDDICFDIMANLGSLVQEVRGVHKSSYRNLLNLCKDYRDFVSHGASENFDLRDGNKTQDGSLILVNPMEAAKKIPNSQERDVAVQEIYLKRFKEKFSALSPVDRTECLSLLKGQMGRGR
ncbi:MAG: hypothetical protein K0R25_166 [Rickettsiaceae bacterium]|nr:hypothetical protein [Rickettsiaceae bacterium]